MVKKHVIITGTGRTGTTFIVQVLTHLGLDTGFTIDNMEINCLGRCGLEQDALIWGATDAPYIIKTPWVTDHAIELFAREDIQIDRIFIPMRDLYAAAESRRWVTEKARGKGEGGLWKVNKPDEQEGILLTQLYNLILAISNTAISITLLQYPRLVRDSLYLYDKLKPILNEISYEKFKIEFKKIVRPDWVHDFKKAVNE